MDLLIADQALKALYKPAPEPARSSCADPIGVKFRTQKEASVIRGANGGGEDRGTGSFQNIAHCPQSLRLFDECMFLMYGEKDNLRRASAAQVRHGLEADRKSVV